MAAAQAGSKQYADGDCPTWKQLNYAVGLLCDLAGVSRPAGKGEMRGWIGELKSMSDKGKTDECPF